MGERPGQEGTHSGPVRTAIATTTIGNASAFGFSITITGAFGMLNALVGTPEVLDILLFGVAAALTIGIVQGAATRGFRERLGEAPSEVRMLGTAQNFLSVAAGLGAAAGVGELMDGTAAWPVGAVAATFVYLAAEAVEMLVAELVQRRRGDPEAQEEQDPE